MTVITKPAEKAPPSRARQLADTALQGGTLGMFHAYFFEAGTNPLPYVAAAFAGGALAVAVRLGIERFTGPAAPPPKVVEPTSWPRSPTAIDDCLRKSLEERIAERTAAPESKEDQVRKQIVVADGPVAQRRGGTWAVSRTSSRRTGSSRAARRARTRPWRPTGRSTPITLPARRAPPA